MTIPASPAKGKTLPGVRCFRRVDGQTIEGCDRIRFRSHGTCEMVYRDDTFEVLPMGIDEAEKAVRRGIWVEVPDSRAAQLGAPSHLAEQWAELRKAKDTAEADLDHQLTVHGSASTDGAFVEAWRKASIALAEFESANGIGGGA